MKNPQFKTQPICEECENEPATAFTVSSFQNPEWKFTGDCTSDNDAYYIDFKRFFHSPDATVDWLAHMNEKNWMNWQDFMAMMHRFRESTKSYGQLNP